MTRMSLISAKKNNYLVAQSFYARGLLLLFGALKEANVPVLQASVQMQMSLLLTTLAQHQEGL